MVSLLPRPIDPTGANKMIDSRRPSRGVGAQAVNPEPPSKRKRINKFISQMKHSSFSDTFATSCLYFLSDCGASRHGVLPSSAPLRRTRLKVELLGGRGQTFNGLIPVHEDITQLTWWLLSLVKDKVKSKSGLGELSSLLVRRQTDGWRAAAAAQMDVLNLLIWLAWHLS